MHSKKMKGFAVRELAIAVAAAVAACGEMNSPAAAGGARYVFCLITI